MMNWVPNIPNSCSIPWQRTSQVQYGKSNDAGTTTRVEQENLPMQRLEQLLDDRESLEAAIKEDDANQAKLEIFGAAVKTYLATGRLENISKVNEALTDLVIGAKENASGKRFDRLSPEEHKQFCAEAFSLMRLQELAQQMFGTPWETLKRQAGPINEIAGLVEFLQQAWSTRRSVHQLKLKQLDQDRALVEYEIAGLITDYAEVKILLRKQQSGDTKMLDDWYRETRSKLVAHLEKTRQSQIELRAWLGQEISVSTMDLLHKQMLQLAALDARISRALEVIPFTNAWDFSPVLRGQIAPKILLPSHDDVPHKCDDDLHLP